MALVGSNRFAVGRGRAWITRAVAALTVAVTSSACESSSAITGASSASGTGGRAGLDVTTGAGAPAVATSFAGVGGAVARPRGVPSAAAGMSGAPAHRSGAGAAADSGGASAAGASGVSAASGSHAAIGGAGGSLQGGAGGRGGDAGSAGGSAGSGATCPLPSRFKWTASGPLAQPKPGWVSLKDFTNVVHNGEYLVYMTTHDTGTKWGSAMFRFKAWTEASSAPQIEMSKSTVAPTLLYFAPKDVWVLAYQWGGPAFSYATASDPTDPSNWTFGKTLYNGTISGSSTGPIDQSLICDDTRCYLFFAGDNGSIYRSSMPLGDFPGTFGAATTILRESTNALFEAVEVYSVRGAGLYLMIVEAIGAGGRYFRAFTSSTLDGTFTAMPEASSEATPFAGKNNVTFEGQAWTNDISHGDLVRVADQTKAIDPCNLQFLYQGRSPSSGGDYGRLPYRPGLLTLVR